MADFVFVTPRVATGAGLSSPEDVELIAAAGVTKVVDCRVEFDDTVLFAQHPDIAVLWNGTSDDGQTKPPEWFGKGIDFALQGLARAHEKVYAHCAAGINRGPSMALAILMALGWSQTGAEALIRAVRPQVELRYKADAVVAVSQLGYT